MDGWMDRRAQGERWNLPRNNSNSHFTRFNVAAFLTHQESKGNTNTTCAHATLTTTNVFLLRFLLNLKATEEEGNLFLGE